MIVLRVASWLAVAVAGLGCITEEPPPPPWVDTGTTEGFLGPEVCPEVALTIEPDAIAALEAQPRAYVKAMITYEGATYGPIGVHLKGQNSFQPITGKPSLRLKIDKYIP